MSTLKSVIRSGKNFAMGYSDTQIKVRQATSNDSWGPSGALMAEISNLSHRSHDFVEIMDIIDKRLNDSGKNWRHVYKTLILLHYLLESGSEQVVSHAKRNLHVIKTLKEFQYIDEEGRDQGMNVRQKCKEVTSLLTDDSKLKEIRANRGVVHDRISGDYQGDDDELRRAIELSKKQMEIDAHKRYGGFPGDENLTLQEQQDLQRAIELSEQEAIQRSINERNNAVSKGDDIIDFFGSLETPQQQQSDPFAGFGGVDPFAQQQMYQQQMYQQQLQQQQMQQQLLLQQQMQQQQLQQQMEQQMRQQQLEQQMRQQQLEQQMRQNSFGGDPFGGNPFGQFAKPAPPPLVFGQQKQTPQPDLNSNLKTIDPFANLSQKGNVNLTDPFGSSQPQSQPFGSSQPQQQSQPFGNNQPFGQTSSQPFGGSSPFGSQVNSNASQGSQPFSNTQPFGSTQSQPFGGSNVSQPFGGSNASQPFTGTSQSAFQQPFGQPSPQKELVNLDSNALSNKSQSPPPKNPFSAGNHNKFQWEPSKGPGPSLAQLQNPQQSYGQMFPQQTGQTIGVQQTGQMGFQQTGQMGFQQTGMQQTGMQNGFQQQPFF